MFNKNNKKIFICVPSYEEDRSYYIDFGKTEDF